LKAKIFPNGLTWLAGIGFVSAQLAPNPMASRDLFIERIDLSGIPYRACLAGLIQFNSLKINIYF